MQRKFLGFNRFLNRYIRLKYKDTVKLTSMVSLFFIVVTPLSMTIYFSSQYYINQTKKVEQYKKELIEDRKSLTKNRVIEVADLIRAYYIKNEDNFSSSHLIDILRVFSKDVNQYIFILDFKGYQILHYNPSYEGRNRIDLSDKNGFKIIENIINVSKNPNGGFTRYYSTLSPKDEISLKISYSKSIDELGWVIGSGVYLGSINKQVDFYKQSLLSSVKRDIMEYLAVFVLMLLFVLVLFNIIYRYLEHIWSRQRDLIEHQNSKLKDSIISYIKMSKQKDTIMSEQSKLAYVGENFSGIMHQWRQILSRILSQASILNFHKNHSPSYTEISKHLTLIIDNAKYLSQTIEDFRKFIVNEPAEYANINTIIKDAIGIFKPLNSDSSINIEYTLFDGNFYVAKELIHPLLNLLNNSKDAFNRSDIKHKSIIIDCKYVDDKLFIYFTDSGGGIKSQIKDKIFDYGFSTKSKSNALGIGLSISKNILEQRLKASIDIQDIKDGTLFCICIKDFKKDINSYEV